MSKSLILALMVFTLFACESIGTLKIEVVTVFDKPVDRAQEPDTDSPDDESNKHQIEDTDEPLQPDDRDSEKDGDWDRSVLDTARDVDTLSSEEKDVIYEINKVRSNPSQYAELYLKPRRMYYRGKYLEMPGQITLVTNEGVKALDECIAVLLSKEPVPILYPREGMSRAARDHAADQSKTGRTGHTGSDGSTLSTRLNRYGQWDSYVGENIDYGSSAARDIVISLLVDDGVSSRGHRENLLHPSFKSVGVAIGTHPKWRYVCVMDFAAEYE